jgi:pimeloyl-ACP methyl ester carboxylesterase
MAAEKESDDTTVQTPGGPVVIRGGIHAKWQALIEETTPDGDDVQSHLGHPLGEETKVPEKHGGGAAQLFDRGMIVERADGRAFVVYGAIYDHYLRVGGTASPIGQPTSDEEGYRDGRVARFDRGDIYWRQDFGAREVRGVRRRRYVGGGDPFTRSLATRALAYGRSILRLRLLGVILGAAVLISGGIGVRAAKGELSSYTPTRHSVLHPLGDACFDSARDLDLRTSKGVVVRGWLRGSTNGAAVILVHGSNSDRTQLASEAHILSAAGYGVLAFDRPGNGESGGEKYRWDETEFLRVAVDALDSEPGLRPGRIGAYGFSSGAAFLAEAAATDTRIRGVVLAGCYADDDDYIRHYRGQGVFSGLPAVWAHRWAGLAFPHPVASVPAIAPRALFLIAGDGDSIVPPDLSKRLYAAAAEPKELWIVHGASHGDYARVAGEEYARRLVAFFDRALLGRGGSR